MIFRIKKLFLRIITMKNWEKIVTLILMKIKKLWFLFEDLLVFCFSFAPFSVFIFENLTFFVCTYFFKSRIAINFVHNNFSKIGWKICGYYYKQILVHLTHISWSSKTFCHACLFRCFFSNSILFQWIPVISFN